MAAIQACDQGRSCSRNRGLGVGVCGLSCLPRGEEFMAGVPETLAAATRKELIATGGDPAALRATVAAYFRTGTALGLALSDLIVGLLDGPQCISRRAYFGDPQMVHLIEIVKDIKTDGSWFG